MKPIPVDYNAALVSGAPRLAFPDTRQALDAINAQPGDLVWVSDGEILVEARLEVDPTDGLVAMPLWETLVHRDAHAIHLETTEKPEPGESP